MIMFLTSCNAKQESVIDNGDGTVTLKLQKFAVVYDSANEQKFIPSVAQAFATRVNSIYNDVEVVEDKEIHEYEILFGACEREDYQTTDREFLFRDYYIGYMNGKISVSAFSIYGYEQAINFLLEGYEKDGITIPTEGFYKEYDYGTDKYAELYRNYENPKLEGAWMLNISHRGDITTNGNPENSLLAYQSSIDNFVDVIEIDLKRTRDGVWVICHDQTIDRTTNGYGNISQMSYEKLQKYYLKTQNGGDDASITEYQIPTLIEVIELCKGKVLLNIDQLEPSIFQEVYDVFEKQDAVEMAMFKSSEWSARDFNNWLCQLLEEGRKLPLFSPLLYADPASAALSFKGLTTMFETDRDHQTITLDYVLDCNIRSMCLTALNPSLENAAYYTELKKAGYTAIMTDEPALLKEFIHGQ